MLSLPLLTPVDTSLQTSAIYPEGCQGSRLYVSLQTLLSRVLSRLLLASAEGAGTVGHESLGYDYSPNTMAPNSRPSNMRRNVLQATKGPVSLLDSASQAFSHARRRGDCISLIHDEVQPTSNLAVL